MARKTATGKRPNNYLHTVLVDEAEDSLRVHEEPGVVIVDPWGWPEPNQGPSFIIATEGSPYCGFNGILTRPYVRAF